MKPIRGIRRAQIVFPVLLGMAAGALAGCPKDPAPASTNANANMGTNANNNSHSDSAAPAQWTCPMHPQIVSDRPGDCPICNMKLVPLPKEPPGGPDKGIGVRGPASEPPAAGLATVTLDAEKQRLLGIKTTAARTAEFAGTIRTSGRFTFDETRVHHIHTRFEAYVEHVYADFTGKFVRKGEPLVSLYSPELFAAEQEYLLAMRSQHGIGGDSGMGPGGAGASLPGLVESARQKLLLWNVSAADIAQLERSGKASQSIKLYAPSSGYIVAKTAVHGMRVRPEDALFDIVDLSRLWVQADLYENELPRLRLGQTATITVPYWPDRVWSGRVTYIYPSVDPQTRTIRVRLEVDNEKAELKAEMLASVTLSVAPHAALVVPDDAVIESGARKLVFVALGDGRLAPREVTTGARADQLFEIKSGLKEGEQVALGAAFLLDSESRLQAAMQRIAGPQENGIPDAGAAKSATPVHADSPDHAGHGGH